MTARKPLVVVEAASEIPPLLEHPKSDAGRFLAVEPAVRVQLLGQVRHLASSREFFGVEDHQALLETLEPLTEVLEEFEIGGSIPPRLSRICTRTVCFRGRFLASALLWLARTMTNALAAQDCDSILVRKGQTSVARDPQLTRSDRVVHGVARAVARSHGVPLLTCDSAETDPGRRIGRFGQKVLDRLRNAYCRYAVRRLADRDEPYILVSSDHYGLDEFARSLLANRDDLLPVFAHHSAKWQAVRSRNRFLTLPRSLSGRQAEAFRAAVAGAGGALHERLEQRDSLLTTGSSCVVDPFLEKLEAGILPHLERLAATWEGVEEVFVRAPPSAVVLQHGRGLCSVLAELADREGIPSLMVSHGSHVPPRGTHADLEWSRHAEGFFNVPHSAFAVQTALADRAFDVWGQEGTRLPTGPLILTRIQPRSGSRRGDGKFEMVHAGTPKHRGALRPLVYETEDEYVANINRLISAVEGIDGYHLTVRFRPSRWLNADEFRALLRPSEAVSVETGGSFTETLKRTDLLVSFSSTTIEEALISGVPVLQFDPDDRYSHVPAERPWRQAVAERTGPSCAYHVNSVDELPRALEWIRLNHLDAPEAAPDFDIFRIPEEDRVPIDAILEHLQRMNAERATE